MHKDGSEETEERLDRLMLLIEDLEPPIRQLIFRLRYLQEKSYQEVADEVGVSKVTVFNHLKQNLEILNAFERIQITEVDGTLRVE